MPHPNAWWLGSFQGRDLKKYCYIIFVMKYFNKFLTILLGIVVSAFAFHARDRGPVRQIFKSTFSPSFPPPPVAITKPSSLD